eukprot:TRINITY_DN11246_c0_g1_i1.p1 TRINITY_DN11246_c0_g1~~TRINITY_DN11246_c0_g1_i1.p1  ORF type:complete len:179 (+),score=59.02 TRINITY_DN11246_c0_g1_i1:45-581(+)
MPRRAARGDAVVVLGGSFAPLHAGHLAALEAGRRRAEAEGYTVVAGYLAVAFDGHLRGKLKSRGEDAVVDMGIDERLAMCNAAAAASTWLQPTPCAYGSAKACGQAMVATQHAPNTRVYTVKGGELPALAKCAGQELSSTYVRREMRAGGVGAVRRLAAAGVLPDVVAQHLSALLESG